MATKKETDHNTGLSIARKGNKFTASWKIRAKDVTKQEIRYRVHNKKKWKGWKTVSVSKKATSYSFKLSSSSKITNIQVQTRVLRTPTAEWKVSDWSDSSAKFKIDDPPTPSLSVTAGSANQTTFSWSINNSDTNHKWFYRCYYRTKCTATPNASGGWSAWTYAASSSYTYTDNTTGRTRIFEIKAVGPGGTSTIKSKRHYIGTAPIATWGKPAVSKKKKSSYYKLTYKAHLTGSSVKVDKIVPQYYIAEPDANMDPDGNSWVDGPDYAYTSGKSTYAMALTTNALVTNDHCLYARIRTEHDSVDSVSAVRRVITGKLTAPTVSVSMGTPLSTGFSVTITISDAGTSVSGAYMQVFLERASAPGVANYAMIGTIPNGTASAVITSTEDITAETGYAIHVRNVTADGVSMFSKFASYETSMPSKPTNLAVKATTVSGKVHVSWDNNWSEATGTVIAWTDDPDNWTSNDEPETYEINDLATGWYITGLETGTVWYFRVRSMHVEDDSVTYSPWSDEVEIDLASAPAVPVLYLSDEVITETGMVTAYWSYVTTDGTSQISGEVVEATYSGGVWTYGNPVGVVTDAQHVDIYAEANGWTNGTAVYLALRTRSGSGGESDYSTPVMLMIAAIPTVAISATSLAATDSVTDYFDGDGATTVFDLAFEPSTTPTATVDGSAVTVSSYSDDTVTLAAAPGDGTEVAITYTTADNETLTALPMTATVTTSDATELTIAVERAYNYPMIRPDGEISDGPAGETVYLDTIPAEASNSISIDLDDVAAMIGQFDDGAFYNLVVTATDDFGQAVSASKLFRVHWTHQAWVPKVAFTTDYDKYFVRIRPIATADYLSGDTCDIYRLGADKPELIYSGAEFGTEYVDPFPAFGEHSGYKIVTVTANGDYITEENEIAVYDTTISGGYPRLDPGLLIIDFNGDHVELPYNLALGNTWTKDFKRTSYLGGHVTGDHNRAVLRDASYATVLAKDIDENIAIKMRALARYAGICHVRTPEGSSFAADVQINENRSYNSGTIDYGLTIQKIDTVGYDGMTYAEWSEMQ